MRRAAATGSRLLAGGVDPSLRAQGSPAYDDRALPSDKAPPRGSTSIAATESSDLDPGLTDQPLETNEINVVGESAPDFDVEAEPATTFYVPTDPVISTDDQGDPTVLGGFAPSSMTEDQVDLSTLDRRAGDEAIADAVRREPHEDAETTHLDFEVVLENVVVHLCGSVPKLDDAADAEEVASRVPGVREVSEELNVPSV